jgi:hypothetical protein
MRTGPRFSINDRFCFAAYVKDSALTMPVN